MRLKASRVFWSCTVLGVCMASAVGAHMVPISPHVWQVAGLQVEGCCLLRDVMATANATRACAPPC
eukprot:11442496-Alexandrium_andersonii.AAC.1